MRAFMAVVERVADSDTTLLIEGETGVGKERLARAIHSESRRSKGPFVAVNCAAIPETLLESELFGHEEGAFTGATRARRGWFELAHGGTILLDEVSDLPLHLQVKLLRVLQEREIRPLGGEKTLSVDVRVVAATNVDLARAVERGDFRKDLYYRLGVVTLTLPPLRDRREDVPDLAQSYVEYYRTALGRGIEGIADDALESLVGYDWPGNVRELMNVIERAVLLTTASQITRADLPEAISRQSLAGPLTSVAHDPGASADVPADWLGRPWTEVRERALLGVERAYLRALLESASGRVGETAARAGMSPRSLYEKMKRHGLRKEDFRT
jgi:transcriptional regulator with GAF, ATPase, and Fis domain